MLYSYVTLVLGDGQTVNLPQPLGIVSIVGLVSYPKAADR